MKRKCNECHGEMEKKTLKIEGLEVRALECVECGETVLHPKDAQQMLRFNKLKKGIKAKVGVLGRSLIVRFPKEVRDFFKITKGDRVKIRAGDRKKLEIVIKNI